MLVLGSEFNAYRRHCDPLVNMVEAKPPASYDEKELDPARSIPPGSSRFFENAQAHENGELERIRTNRQQDRDDRVVTSSRH